MHDIFCAVCVMAKTNHPIGRGRGYRYGLPNQVLFQVGERNETPFAFASDFEYFGDCG
jgi:hypothetical protein